MSSVVKETISDLQIMLHKSGNYTMPSMHYHDAYEIGIIEDGDRSYVLEDKLVYLKPRDVILIKKNKLHYTVGGTYKGTLLEFSHEYLRKFFSEHAISILTECFEKSIIRVRESDFSELLCLVERLYADNEDVASLVKMFDILKNNMSRKTYDLQSAGTRIAEIVDYITENYKSIDSLDVITDKFYVSKQYLCSLFKDHTNTSIMKYINILKIHASLELLSQKELSIAEIAQRSGFSSLSYFSKTFKSVTGTSPLKYSKVDAPSKNEE